ncbi:biotin carboxylase N-terminal domain-containing protein [Nocardia sp. NPDC047038]|uniref:acetyl-CoA carboxylase biotin carboxylase subunit n=1 Tax=Nocardia sp. NPDC047038 TaxID=3154338 RepID=UPI0033E6F9E0
MSDSPTILVANRGEIAVRIIRAIRELGHVSALVVSDADRDSLASRLADRTIVLPGTASKDTYLNGDAIISAAREAGAVAVHPGYGFLSEHADFARAVIDSGLTWVGPSPDLIAAMGDKATALQRARAAGLPTVPGSDGVVASATAAVAVAEAIGYPVAIKATAGGGGRGIRIVQTPDELVSMWDVTAAEAVAAFGDGRLYLEKFIPRARHVEVQVFGDGTRFVHLHDRDCSLQRRHQKLIEECPAPGIPVATRSELHESACRLAAEIEYVGAGTVEYLYDPDTDKFHFIEMNTRIQVEHPITEELLGVDLVQEQLAVALGAPMSFEQDALIPRGHAIELRINAENPRLNFFPSPGVLTSVSWPSGPGVRIDAGVATGDAIPPFYDSMIGKIIVWGSTRHKAISRARRVLDEFSLEGVSNTAAFVGAALADEAFVAAAHHTKYLEERLDVILAGLVTPDGSTKSDPPGCRQSR